MGAHLRGARSPEIVIECHHCGTSVEGTGGSCPTCGATGFAEYRVAGKRPAEALRAAHERTEEAYASANMTQTIEIDDDLAQQLESHLEEDETIPEFIAELVAMYETEGAFLQEGYSE